MKTLMVLGAGQGQLPILKQAEQMENVYCVVVDKDKNAIGVQHADLHLHHSVKETDIIMEMAKSLRIDGIIAPCADAGLQTYGKIVTELGLKGIHHRAIDICCNKNKFHKVMRKYGVKVPDRYDDLFEESFPVIVKPSDGVSSKGVYKIESFYQRPHPKELLEDAKTYSSDGNAIIQRYYSEPIFNCDLVIQDNKIKYYMLHDEGIFAGKKNFGADYFVYPSSYRKHEYYIVEVCRQIIDVLEITDGNIAVEGVVCNQGRFTENGFEYNDEVVVIEVNPRLSGTFHIETHSDSSGINWAEDAINIALGEKVESKLCYPVPHGWMLIGAEEDGFIERIDLEGLMYAYSDLFTAWKLKKEGDFVKSYKCQETSTDNAVVAVYTKDDSGLATSDAIVVDMLFHIENSIKIHTRRWENEKPIDFGSK